MLSNYTIDDIQGPTCGAQNNG